MTLSESESSKIKEELLKQLGNFPEEKREEIKEKVESMNDEQFEEFVEENDLNDLDKKCIFCAIIAGKMPSIKISENEENLAILEINPLSKGHTLIIPKKHLDKIPESTISFAENIGKLLKERLNPQEIKVNELSIMNHKLLEVVPLFGEETERHQATEEELKEVFESITKPARITEENIGPKEDSIKIVEKLPKLPPRIPN